MDSGFQVLDSRFFVSEFRIPVVRGVLDSLSCIPDSANKNFADSEILIFLQGAKYSSLVIYLWNGGLPNRKNDVCSSFINKNVTRTSTYSLFQIFKKDLLPAVMKISKGAL